jgi:type I restriction enzyme, S subunit
MEKWKLKTLGEIAEVQSGGTPLRSRKEYWSGEISWYSSGELNETFTQSSKDFITQMGLKESNAKLFPKGSLLIGMYDTAALKMSILDRDAAFNQAIAGVKVNENIDLKFILYAINSKRFEILNQRRGVRQKNLSLAKIKDITLPVLSLIEQKRIVSIVDEAFEVIDIAIDNTKQNLANARELFESYLDSRLFNVVSGKATQTLLCITDLIIDCEHKTAPIQEEGIPSIRTPNIGKGHLIFDGVYRVSEETYELWTRRGKPEPGDLILAREAPAGNVGVVPPGAKVCLGQRTVLIRPNKKIIDSHYLAFLLLHPIVQKRLLDKSTGATVQHVNMKDIRGLSMSELPSIQVQKACVEELEHLKSEVNRLEAIYQQKLAALNELKQSILHKAFTGELTADKADLKTNIEPEAIAV